MKIYMRIEITKGSSNKIEFNLVKKRLELDRVLPGAMFYPEEYGSFEDTLDYDGDQLDGICLTIQPTISGIYVPVRIVGVLKMIDGDEQDDKLLVVNDDEPRLNYIKELKN